MRPRRRTERISVRPSLGYKPDVRGQTMNDDATPIDDETIVLTAHIKALRQEHADLDASIEALMRMPIPDQLLIARMKRKKLLLRDEIVKIEGRMLPDIIA